MKRILLFGALALSFLSYASAQQNGSRFEFSLQTAHPKAKALMKDDFFWSPIDDAGPFGSDGGSDAAYGFHDWRPGHFSESPIIYLGNLIERYQYPPIAWDELDTNRLKEYMHIDYAPDEAGIDKMVQLLKNEQDENAKRSVSAKKLTDEQLRQIVVKSGNNMGASYLTDLDESIIGTAFAQICMEGRLDVKLKYYVTKALQREMLPLITRNYGNANQRQAYNDKMRKLLFVVNQMK
ncbi:MAG TPA: hypothetical protein VG605_07955 [Puia sp.]|nr:hypothetical protein [Puia sp.]